MEELRLGVPGRRPESDESDENLLYTIKVKEEGEVGVGMCVWSKLRPPD